MRANSCGVLLVFTLAAACGDDGTSSGGSASGGGGAASGGAAAGGGETGGGVASGGAASGGGDAGGTAQGGQGGEGGGAMGAWQPPSYDGYFVDLELPTPSQPSAGVSFYENIAYGDDAAMRFDLFQPASATATPLIIFIHGGGFTGGNKTSGYDSAGDQAKLANALEAGIAYASINYRLLDEVDSEGVYKSLSDSRRALQFIRYHAAELNIDPERIALRGSSAGAGTGLWLAFHDDMAGGDDVVANESTRVAGVAISATQSTYDLVKWSTVVFADYGIDLMTSVAALEMEQRLASFYGLPTISDLEGQLESPAISEYRHEVDMLDWMSPDDPPFYVSNPLAETIPTSQNELFHHPYHARALRERAAQVGVACSAEIQALDIDDAPGVNDWEFVIELLSQ